MISYLAPLFASMLMLLYLVANRNSESYFSPLVWFFAFYFLIFTIRPVLAEFSDLHIAWDYMRIVPTDQLITSTNIVSALGAFGYLIGYHTANKSQYPGFAWNGVGNSSETSWKLVAAVVAILGPVAFYSAYLTGASQTIGGIEMDRVDGFAVNVEQNGYLSDAQFMIIGLSLLLAWRSHFSLIVMAPTIAYLIFRALIGWGRWSIVLTMLALYGLHLYLSGRRWPPLRAAILAIPIFLLFQMLGEDRQALGSLIWGRQAEYTNVVQSGDWIQRTFDGLDFANFEYLAYLVKHVPDSTGTYTFGTQYLQIFTEPIPRALWSEKPAGPPIQLFRLNDYGNFLGLTLSVIGDGWSTLGYPGTAIICSLYGFGFGWLYTQFRTGRFGTFGTLGYIGLSGMFIQFFRDGNIVSLVKFPAITLAALLLCKLLTTITTQRKQ